LIEKIIVSKMTYWLVAFIVVIIVIWLLDKDNYVVADAKLNRTHVPKMKYTYSEPRNGGEVDLVDKIGFSSLTSIPVEQDADEKLVARNLDTGRRFKQITDGRVRNGVNEFERYFRTELDNVEGQEWWGGETDDALSDFNRNIDVY
jgi:hypothetical protein